MININLFNTLGFNEEYVKQALDAHNNVCNESEHCIYPINTSSELIEDITDNVNETEILFEFSSEFIEEESSTYEEVKNIDKIDLSSNIKLKEVIPFNDTIDEDIKQEIKIIESEIKSDINFEFSMIKRNMPQPKDLEKIKILSERKKKIEEEKAAKQLREGEIATVDTRRYSTDNLVHGKEYIVKFMKKDMGISETKAHYVVSEVFKCITETLIDKGRIKIGDYNFYTDRPLRARKYHVFCDIEANINKEDEEQNTENKQLTESQDTLKSDHMYILIPDNKIYTIINNIFIVNGIRTNATDVITEIPFLRASKNDVDISQFEDNVIMPKELFTYKEGNRNMLGLRFMNSISDELADLLKQNNVDNINIIDPIITVGSAYDFGIKERFVKPKQVPLQFKKAVKVKIKKTEI